MSGVIPWEQPETTDDQRCIWFKNLSLEEQFYKTIEANAVIVGDRSTHPSTLSVGEVIAIAKYHEAKNKPFTKDLLDAYLDDCVSTGKAVQDHGALAFLSQSQQCHIEDLLMRYADITAKRKMKKFILSIKSLSK